MNSSKRLSVKNFHTIKTNPSPKKLHVVMHPNNPKEKKKSKSKYIKENFVSMLILVIGIFFVWLLL